MTDIIDLQTEVLLLRDLKLSEQKGDCFMNIYLIRALSVLVMMSGCSHSTRTTELSDVNRCQQAGNWLESEVSCSENTSVVYEHAELIKQIDSVSWQFVGLKQRRQWLHQVKTYADDKPITIQFKQQRFSGQAQCNGFFGRYKTLDTNKPTSIAIKDIATTRMLCAPEQMEEEIALLMWLKKAKSLDVINNQLIIMLNKDKSLVFEQENNIVESVKSAYQSCAGSQEALLLGVSDNQCVANGVVYFADHRPSISLQYCSHYFDGCNNHIVSSGQLGASTLMACPQEFELPACYIDQRVYQKSTGRVLKISSNSIDIVFDDIVEVFQIENKNHLKQLVVGDEVTVEYSQGHDYQDKKLLAIYH